MERQPPRASRKWSAIRLCSSSLPEAGSGVSEDPTITGSVSYHDNAQGNAVVTVDNAGDTITLVGVHASELHASDFHFVDPASAAPASSSPTQQ
jgi:hypothetical protein